MQASNFAHKKTIASLKRANGDKLDKYDDDIKDAGNSLGGKSKKIKIKTWLFGRLEIIAIVLTYVVELYKYFKNRSIHEYKLATIVNHDTMTINRGNIAAFVSLVFVIGDSNNRVINSVDAINYGQTNSLSEVIAKLSKTKNKIVTFADTPLSQKTIDIKNTDFDYAKCLPIF